MIKSLYTKNQEFPYVSFFIASLCVVITTLAYLDQSLYPLLVSTYPVDYSWQYISGAFLHGLGDGHFAITFVHLFINLLMFLPYAIIIEKALGHRNFVITFLLAWISFSVTFQLLSRQVLLAYGASGEKATGAGLSGIAFSYIAMGTYVILSICATNPTLALKQPLTYLFGLGLVGELLILNPRLAGMSPFLMHVVGIVTGIILVIIFRKEMKKYLKL